jgi:hypothetical protein
VRPFLLLLVCLAGLGLSACSTVQRDKYPPPATFAMEQIAPRVYVDPKMTNTQRLALSGAIATARQRIHLYFGNVVADPEIFACVTMQCVQQDGGGLGEARPDDASRLFLAPDELTAPMIAHAWSHAEFSTRVGTDFAGDEIPRWFDEGLAVLVSNEPTHSEEMWQALKEEGRASPALNELESREKWLAAEKKYGATATNKEQYEVVYVTAGHEVRSWYRKAGKAGLIQLIEAIRQGRPFTRAYQEAQGNVLPDHASPYRNFNSDFKAGMQPKTPN